MAEDKSVFISSRRGASQYLGRSLFMELRERGYDVFLDPEEKDPDLANRVVLPEAERRSHFILIISAATLDECRNPKDQLLRTFVTARLNKRNVIPVLDGVAFREIESQLMGTLTALENIPCVPYLSFYQDSFLEKLTADFLSNDVSPAEGSATMEVQGMIEDMAALGKPSKRELQSEAFKNEGYLYRKHGEFAKAIDLYTKALDITPDYAIACNGRGQAYADTGEHQRAIEDYHLAIQADPEFAKAYNNRGTSYGVLGDRERAIADFDRALELDPNFAQAYYNRGRFYKVQGENQKSVEDCDQAIEHYPGHKGALIVRGAAYSALGDNHRAVDDYDQVLEADPNHEYALYNRGLSHGKLGNYEQAKADLQKLLELNPNFHNAKAALEKVKAATWDMD